MGRTKEFDELEVLDKAVTLFWEKGYHATSMQDLVDGLGISRSSLYASYGDKHALFLSALERYRSKASGHVTQLIAGQPDARSALASLFRLDAEMKPKGCFVVNATAELGGQDQAACSVTASGLADMRQIFADVVHEGQARGEFSTSLDAEALGLFFGNAHSGLQIAIKGGLPCEQIRSIVETTLSVLDR